MTDLDNAAQMNKIEETKKIANELLLEKYEPILVIKLIRIPPVDELQAFASKIQKDFGYQTLVLPGELETSVDIVSVCKTESIEIETLKNKVYETCKVLEKELDKPMEFKTAKEIIEDGKKT
tara:strand:+ start:2658 stop:3023 length:366 start_codon:yes stop_codon:yes gene_type:complete